MELFLLKRRPALRTAALVVVRAADAFLAIGAVFDLATDARGQLPGDHSAAFRAVTGTSWQHAASIAHPATSYVTRAEAGYAAYELLFAALILTVGAIPLRRGERWAWWCCWLIILAFATFAALFGAGDRGNLGAAIAAAILVAVALLVLRPRGAGLTPSKTE
jgi:hypothetical protein